MYYNVYKGLYTHTHTHTHVSQDFKEKKYNNKLFPVAFSALVDVLFSNGVGYKCNHSKFTTVGV